MIDPLAPGALLIGPFPRMGGKRRPAACVFVTASGAVALCPGTSVKNAQAGRVYLPAGRLGTVKPTWLLAPLTVLFPPGSAHLAAFERIGALAAAEEAALQSALRDAYGEDWSARLEQRSERIAAPARVEPLGRAARRRALKD